MHTNKITTLAVQKKMIQNTKTQVRKSATKSLTDELVLSSLTEELSKNMEQTEVTKWVNNIIDICKQLKIAPKRLPVNKDLPGNLTKEESHKFANMVFQHII